jgi:hypothetical protein
MAHPTKEYELSFSFSCYIWKILQTIGSSRAKASAFVLEKSPLALAMAAIGAINTFLRDHRSLEAKTPDCQSEKGQRV